MAHKFMALVNGVRKMVSAITVSAGASDAGKIPAVGDDGRFDESFMPLGIGADTVVCPASEALSAGNFVNFHQDGGVLKCRLADNSNGRVARGFVKEPVSSSADATVYPLDSTNASLSSLTVGADYWLGTAGGVTATPLSESDPLNDGKVSQWLGIAKSETELGTDDQGHVIL